VTTQLALRRLALPRRSEAWVKAGNRALAIAFWVILPALCLTMLILGTDKLSRHLNNVPPGTLGTYHVTSHSCTGEVCIVGGTFTSADGRLVETDLLGVYSWQNGGTHKAIYNTGSIDVIPLPAHWDPTSTFAGMTGALGFLVLWSVFLYGAIRRRVVARSASVLWIAEAGTA
jgi:hypothetical protein